jgi:hypothetical protein
MAALGRFFEQSDIDLLKLFVGKSVTDIAGKKHPFETDLNWIRRRLAKLPPHAASFLYATATGYLSIANGDTAIAKENLAVANGQYATATGSQANAYGPNATATGTLANDTGTLATRWATARRSFCGTEPRTRPKHGFDSRRERQRQSIHLEFFLFFPLIPKLAEAVWAILFALCPSSLITASAASEA